MNILMISDVYFPRINGVSTSIDTFRKALSCLGHQVSLIAPDYKTRGDDDAGISRVPSRYLVLDPEDRIMQARHILALEAEIAERSFDLLHIQTPFIAHKAGIELARRLHLPVVESYHTYFEEYLYHYVPFVPRALMRSAARWLTRRQCNRVNAVAVPSRSMHEVLIRYGVTVPVSIVPTGIEFNEIQGGSRERFCETHGINPARPILVYVGRVAHEKNIGFLLEMLIEVRQVYPEILLVIAGEGPAYRSFIRKTAELGLQNNVRIMGYLERGPALWDCFCAGDIFVFASATETQGLVLLEAMSLGVPIVSTAVMGTKDILDAGKGALVADDSVTDFSGQVIRLLSDDALRMRLSEEGRNYVQEWSAECNARRMINFYDSVLARQMQDGLVSDSSC